MSFLTVCGCCVRHMSARFSCRCRRAGAAARRGGVVVVVTVAAAADVSSRPYMTTAVGLHRIVFGTA